MTNYIQLVKNETKVIVEEGDAEDEIITPK